MNKHIEYDHNIIDYLHQHNVPISILEGPEFISFMKAIDTSYNIPTCNDAICLLIAKWIIKEQIPLASLHEEYLYNFFSTLNVNMDRLTKENIIKRIYEMVVTRERKDQDYKVAIQMKAIVSRKRDDPNDTLGLQYRTISKPMFELGEASIQIVQSAIEVPSLYYNTNHQGISGHMFIGIIRNLGVGDLYHDIIGMNTWNINIRKELLGKRVIASPIIPCKSCRRKSDKDAQYFENLSSYEELQQRIAWQYSTVELCQNTTTLGLTSRHGTLAEWITLPIDLLHVIPDNIPDDIALLIGDLAIVDTLTSILKQQEITQQKLLSNIFILIDESNEQISVSIVALIGLFFHYNHLLWAERMSIENSIHFELILLNASNKRNCDAWLRTCKEKIPYDNISYHLVNGDELIKNNANCTIRKGLADAVIDLSGTETSIRQAVYLVRPLGSIVSCNNYLQSFAKEDKNSISIDMNTIVVNEVQFNGINRFGSFHPKQVTNIIKWLETQVLDTELTLQLRQYLTPNAISLTELCNMLNSNYQFVNTDFGMYQRIKF